MLNNISADVPQGNIADPAIVSNLLNALQLKGPHARIIPSVAPGTSLQWLDTRSSSHTFEKEDKVQTVVMKLLKGPSLELPIKQRYDIMEMIRAKTHVTFGPEVGTSDAIVKIWWCRFCYALERCKPYVRMCWLKTIGGAWTTTCRSHEYKANPDVEDWPCIFGCDDAKDNIQHYINCPELWKHALEVTEGVWTPCIAEKICLFNPSVLKLKRLAIAHATYHACKHDPVCIVNEFPAQAHVVNTRAVGHATAFRSFVD